MDFSWSCGVEPTPRKERSPLTHAWRSEPKRFKQAMVPRGVLWKRVLEGVARGVVETGVRRRDWTKRRRICERNGRGRISGRRRSDLCGSEGSQSAFIAGQVSAWSEPSPRPNPTKTDKDSPKKKDEAKKRMEALYVGRWLHEGDRATLEIKAGRQMSIDHNSPAGRMRQRRKINRHRKADHACVTVPATRQHESRFTQTQMLLMHNGQFAFSKSRTPHPSPRHRKKANPTKGIITWCCSGIDPNHGSDQAHRQ